MRVWVYKGSAGQLLTTVLKTGISIMSVHMFVSIVHSKFGMLTLENGKLRLSCFPRLVKCLTPNSDLQIAPFCPSSSQQTFNICLRDVGLTAFKKWNPKVQRNSGRNLKNTSSNFPGSLTRTHFRCGYVLVVELTNLGDHDNEKYGLVLNAYRSENHEGGNQDSWIIPST